MKTGAGSLVVALALAGCALWPRSEPAPAPSPAAVVPGWLVARAEPDRTETTGTVVAVDPAGTVSVMTPEGPLRFWTAEPGTQPFQAGQAVRARIRVQVLDLVPAPPGDESTSDAPAAFPMSESGEYALFRGRVLAADPTGRLTVESPRGPVTVAVPAVGRYRPGDWVELSTLVSADR